MNKSKIKDWFIWGEWYGLFWFHACYFEGLAKTIKKEVGIGLSQVVIEQNKNIQTAYLSRSEWSKVGQKYLAEIVKSPAKLARLLFKVRKAADSLTAFSDKLKKLDLAGLTKKQKLGYLEQYHNKHHLLWALGQVPNVLELENYLLSDYLKTWLAGRKLTAKEQADFFQILSTPRELSMAQKEEREMLKLAVTKNPGGKLEKHWQKYSWLNFGWTGPSLDLKYFQGCHQGLYREGQSKAKLQEILNKDKKLSADKRRIIKQLAPPPKTRKLFTLFEELLFLKAHRMDALYLSYEAVWPLLKEIARDYGLSLPQVYSLESRWLIKMIKDNSIDVDRINEIADFSVYYFDGKNDYLLVGKEAEKISRRIKSNLPKVENEVELKGETAFAGKVTGKVKVINLAEEMPKFEDGDILVSNVTDPSLLPIMKKAKAFVTNMGGLTCHAAIVARELGTPCVVGTKIATKVLKDGDMVEVDANKGVVRKLS